MKYYSDPNYEYNVLMRLIYALWENGFITDEEENFIITGNIENEEGESDEKELGNN